MSAEPIIVAASRVVARARALSKLQDFLTEAPSPEYQKRLLMMLWAHDFISADATALLIEANSLEAV